MEKRLRPAGRAKKGRPATWLKSPCLGQCERAPAVISSRRGRGGGLEKKTFAPATGGRRDGWDSHGAPPPHIPASPPPADLAPASRPPPPQAASRRRPESLDDYRAHGATPRWPRLEPSAPKGSCRSLDSKLVGRAAPPSRPAQMEAVARQPVRPHYLVCNADEPRTQGHRLQAAHDRGGRRPPPSGCVPQCPGSDFVRVADR